MSTVKRTYDALPSPRDVRDFRMMAVDVRTLPDVATLPRVPILDQGAEGACVGHGCAGAREVLEVIVSGGLPPEPLSRAFIYYEARKLEGTQDQDAGAYVRDGCKVLNTIGVCTEGEFPYAAGHFRDVPSDLEITTAATYRIDTYARLNSSDEVRAALAVNRPVVIGISVFKSFETGIGADGLVPVPAPGEEELGGHCMYLWGYQPDPRHLGMYLFDGSNSWGEGWGDSGHFHMPQEYLNNPNLCSDMWSLAINT